MSAIKVLKNDTAEVFYEDAGHGFPVILLHGFGEDRSIWDIQVAALCSAYRVITPDLPGTGQSTIRNNASITIPVMAGLIRDLLDQEGISHCILLGHSMGGYITLCFAEAYPEYLKGFGLIHSTAFADSEEKKQNRDRGIALMESYGGHAFLKTTIPNLFGPDFKEQHAEKIDLLIEQARTFQTKALQDYYATMRDRPDRTHVLRNSSVPVLFILGTEDVAAPLNDLLQQTYLPEISYIHILDRIGHMGMWEASEQLSDHLLRYIEQAIAQT